MNSPRPKLREPREQLPHFDGRREAVARLLAAYQSPQADRHAAWHAFHAAYCGPVRAFACRCGVTDEDLGDCVQEVWAELLLRLPTFQFDPKRGAFDSWLFQIVRGKAADLRRSRVRHRGRENGATLQELIDARPCPARVLEQREFLSVAWEQVRNLLSGPNFEVLRMRLEGRPVAEVAAALGLNVEQVWYRYHRARRELEGLGAAWAAVRWAAPRARRCGRRKAECRRISRKETALTCITKCSFQFSCLCGKPVCGLRLPAR
ncbi:MAG: sigma-70 family RNA polymerase sigma factor [Gemmataceae bacterium]